MLYYPSNVYSKMKFNIYIYSVFGHLNIQILNNPYSIVFYIYILFDILQKYFKFMLYWIFNYDNRNEHKTDIIRAEQNSK